MKHYDILKKYFGIADYIAAINGSSCEVIVHNLSDLQHSIVHIVNGHITNRKIGGSITDFALELLQKKDYAQQDSITNYIGTTKDNKILKSSTYFIKDNENNIIGLLCVNINITDLLRAKEFIDNIIMVDELNKANEMQIGKENFNVSVDDIVENIINSIIIESGIELADSSVEKKMQLIKAMEARGVFKFKGSVNTVSKLLNVSTQSIYRYLKNLKTNN